MKKLLFSTLLLCVLAVMNSCKSDDPEPVYDPAVIKTFGFTIDGEFYAGTITTNAITVNVPYGTDVTALVAEFTTNPNNVVKIGTVTQVSATTPNNFTYPVDYTVTEGTNNAQYAVTVVEMAEGTWALSATKAKAIYGQNIDMAVSPVDGTPYIIAMAKEADGGTSAERFPLVYKVTGVGTAIENAGAAENLTSNRCDKVCLNVGTDGIPYASFIDYDKSTKLSVMACNNGAWSYVGEGGFAVKSLNNSAVVPVGGGKLLAFSNNAAAGTNIPKRGLCMSEYSGSAWTTELVVPGYNTANNAYYLKTREKGDDKYLAIYQQSNQSVSVYKYNNGTWTTLVDSYNYPLADGSGTSTIYAYDFDFDVDSEGNLYIAVGIDIAVKGTYKPTVLKYTLATSAWSIVDAPLEINSSSSRYLSFAIAKDDVPYFMYRSEDNTKFEVVHIDRKTMKWTQPTAITPAAGGVSDGVIGFAADGTGYISFADDANIVVYTMAVPAL